MDSGGVIEESERKEASKQASNRRLTRSERMLCNRRANALFPQGHSDVARENLQETAINLRLMCWVEKSEMWLGESNRVIRACPIDGEMAGRT